MLRVADVIAVVADQYEMPVTVLLDKEMRSLPVTRARHIAQYLSCKLTFHSLKQIGAEFGTDHSGVIYGRERTASMMLANREFRTEIDAIKAKLNTKRSAK